VQVREEGVIFVQHGDHRRVVGGRCRDRYVLSAHGWTEVLNDMKMSDSGPISFSASRPRSARPASRRPQSPYQVEDAQNLRPIAYHLTIAYLPPAQHAVPVYYKGGAPGHVAVFVEDAVGADDGAVDVAQERERESLGLGVSGVCEGAVGADGQDRRATLPDLRVDLDQAAELRRSNAAPVEAVEDQHHVLSAERR
jgi:hypothetical protein